MVSKSAKSQKPRPPHLQRNGELKPAAGGIVFLGPDPSPVRMDDGLADGQSETGAGGVSGRTDGWRSELDSHTMGKEVT
jgi:hypothetical protein